MRTFSSFHPVCNFLPSSVDVDEPAVGGRDGGAGGEGGLPPLGAGGKGATRARTGKPSRGRGRQGHDKGGDGEDLDAGREGSGLGGAMVSSTPMAMGFLAPVWGSWRSS
jgi:hypothetical protein